MAIDLLTFHRDASLQVGRQPPKNRKLEMGTYVRDVVLPAPNPSAKAFFEHLCRAAMRGQGFGRPRPMLLLLLLVAQVIFGPLFCGKPSSAVAKDTYHESPCKPEEIARVTLKVWAASASGEHQHAPRDAESYAEISVQLKNDGESPRAAARSFALLYSIDKESEKHVHASSRGRCGRSLICNDAPRKQAAKWGLQMRKPYFTL